MEQHITNSNGNTGLHVKQAFRHWIDTLGDKLYDIESWRVPSEGSTYRQIVVPKPPNMRKIFDRYDTYAVTILADGRAFLGVSKCHWKDEYSKRKGHAISVGRALKQAAQEADAPLFTVPMNGKGPALQGRELRSYCHVEVDKIESAQREEDEMSYISGLKGGLFGRAK